MQTNRRGAAKKETLLVSNFESNVKSIKQLIGKFYSKWLELTSDPWVLDTVKGQFIEFTQGARKVSFTACPSEKL